MEIRHRPRKHHQNADALSRLLSTDDKDNSLPALLKQYLQGEIKSLVSEVQEQENDIPNEESLSNNIAISVTLRKSLV